MATAQLSPVSSMSCSTLKAYSLNSSQSMACASTWLLTHNTPRHIPFTSYVTYVQKVLASPIKCWLDRRTLCLTSSIFLAMTNCSMLLMDFHQLPKRCVSRENQTVQKSRFGITRAQNAYIWNSASIYPTFFARRGNGYKLKHKSFIYWIYDISHVGLEENNYLPLAMCKVRSNALCSGLLR